MVQVNYFDFLDCPVTICVLYVFARESNDRSNLVNVINILEIATFTVVNSQ